MIVGFKSFVRSLLFLVPGLMVTDVLKSLLPNNGFYSSGRGVLSGSKTQKRVYLETI